MMVVEEQDGMENQWLNKLEIVSGPIWITPLSGFTGLNGTIKLDFIDTRDSANLKFLLNKPVVINGMVCCTLPWYPKPSAPQCHKCCWWGHVNARCNSPHAFSSICAGRHPTTHHDVAIKQGYILQKDLICINCFTAGIDSTHNAFGG